MVEIHLEESDRLDWALKAFKRKIAKAGILKDLRAKRHYLKPSERKWNPFERKEPRGKVLRLRRGRRKHVARRRAVRHAKMKLC